MSDDAELARLFEQGLAQQRAGQHRAAIQIFHVVRRRGGASARLQCRLGESYEQIGDIARANDAFVAAITLDPDHDEAYLRASNLAWRTGDWAARQGQAGPAADLRRGAYEFLASLGARRMQRGAWRDAEAAFRAVLPIAPEDWAVHVDLGRCLYEQGRNEAGEIAIRVGLQHGPDKPLAHFYLAMVLLRRGEVAAAEAALRQALTLDPDLALARDELARLVAQNDKPADEAVDPPA